MEAILNNLIKAIGWSIFHSLWQGAVVYGILLLALSILPKRSAGIKHNMAYAAMCLTFAGFCITFFSLFKLPASPAPVGIAAAENFRISETAQLIHVSEGLYNRAEQLFPYLVALYAAGLLFQLCILTVGYKRLLNLKKAGREAVPEEWQNVFQTMVSRLDLRRKIGFFLSEQVNVPLVIGYLKPIVLFPAALASQLDIKQVEAILIHELSHIRRNDYLLNLIKTGIETLLFFNPFIWLGSKLINIEREHACDDLVLSFTGTPVTYAHALLKLEILKDKSSPALSMAATGGNQHLYQRIKRITDMKTNYMNAKQQFFAITLSVATVISLAWISPEKTKAADAKNAKVKKVIKSVRSQNLNMSMQPINLNSSNAEQLAPCDTTKKKKKFKIVAVDAQGNQQEYNTIAEMPDSLKKEVIRETFSNKDYFPSDFGDAFKTMAIRLKSVSKDSFGNITIHSPNMSDVYVNQLRINGETIANQAKSIEAAKHAIELRIKGAEIAKANSKAIQADIAKIYKLEDMKNLEVELSKMQNIVVNGFKLKDPSPEIREQMQKVREFHNSPEYKKLKKKFEADLEKIKKKKGIKSGNTGTFDYSFQYKTDVAPTETRELRIETN